LNPKRPKYNLLQQELQLYVPMMKEARKKIIEEGISNYPIMVIHKEEIDIGIQLADREKVVGNWSVNASTLEEFLKKNLIEENKIDSFQTIYKSRKNYICMFVLSELGAEFIFIPDKIL